ncbi:hypothetical protein ACFE04_022731 [Oxalis oulophora]
MSYMRIAEGMEIYQTVQEGHSEVSLSGAEWRAITWIIGNFVVWLLWRFLHLIVSICHFAAGIRNMVESYFIATGFLTKYNDLDIKKVKYLAIVIESEEAYNIAKVFELLRWLKGLGVKRLCLYDSDGVLKKSKKFIFEKFNEAISFEEAIESDKPLERDSFVLEFISFCDGKEAVAKAANFMFQNYMKLNGEVEKDQIFTEAKLTEALGAIGCRGTDPDLLLVYGPARCHMGFPAWRLPYTEIVHMGPLKSMRYGSLKKTIYKYTKVHKWGIEVDTKIVINKLQPPHRILLI